MKGVKSGKLIKIVLLGQTGVGKTSIIRRFVDNKFEDKISATIAIDYEMKPMEYKKKKRDPNYRASFLFSRYP